MEIALKLLFFISKPRSLWALRARPKQCRLYQGCQVSWNRWGNGHQTSPFLLVIKLIKSFAFYKCFIGVLDLIFRKYYLRRTLKLLFELQIMLLIFTILLILFDGNSNDHLYYFINYNQWFMECLYWLVLTKINFEQLQLD